MASRPRQRLPLGRRRGRIGYEKRLHVGLALLGLPVYGLLAVLLWTLHASPLAWLASSAVLVLLWAALQVWLAEQLLRPLQTLSNVVAALREQDYSFRARGARRGDSLGDLALEINALAGDLQAERLLSLESAALVRRVLGGLGAPVFAFDGSGVLRLLNPAGAKLIEGEKQSDIAEHALGRHAAALGMEHLLLAADEQVVRIGATQWMVRRSQFREGGVPHQLLLLADISQVLRDEQQQAWQRLIRVLGHEINNSLTPIKSLAGSLRQLLRAGAEPAEFDRPLEVIEDRADSLNRFLTAYRQLAQLPPPARQAVALAPLVGQLPSLELRVPVYVEAGEPVTLFADRDQLAQALINLVRNGAEAALENGSSEPRVALRWEVRGHEVAILVRDTGLGLANPSNLFVPFYTTKAQGTGTGLMLVKQIAEAHQGAVMLRSHAEGGAEAELRLPLHSS